MQDPTAAGHTGNLAVRRATGGSRRRRFAAQRPVIGFYRPWSTRRRRRRQRASLLDQAPQAVECLYYHAVALGLEARAHPSRAVDSLKMMLEALTSAEAVDPAYDEAGPARVKALVLIRAPGWPLGPGDPDAGLAAARRAVSLRPQYPPNVLALAEALEKTGDTRGARETFMRAQALGQAMPPTSDRDDWVRQATQALGRLKSFSAASSANFAPRRGHFDDQPYSGVT